MAGHKLPGISGNPTGTATFLPPLIAANQRPFLANGGLVGMFIDRDSTVC